MSDELSADIRWKLENVQHTGSFKLRGASNALHSLDAEQRSFDQKPPRAKNRS